MKNIPLFLIMLVLVISLISCSGSSKEKEDQSVSQTSDSVPEKAAEKEEPAVELPAGPISVAEALPMLEKWQDQTITVSASYIGNYGSGETLTFRLMDSAESTEELECVFEITDDVDLFAVGFGEITIKGIVWNNQLVMCEIVKK